MTPTAERTPRIIAAEINTLNHQTGRTLLTNAIEIGGRLKEAKALIKHGEWGQWLAESVRYSQRSAGRLIQLYEAYGVSPDLEGDPNWSALSNLTYTNALILLDVPEELRADFIAHNDVGNMSSRELKRAVGVAVADGDGEHSPFLPKLDQALQKIDDLEKVLNIMIAKISDLADQVRSLEKRVEEATSKFRTERRRAGRKEANSDESPKEAVPAAAQSLQTAGPSIPAADAESPQASETAGPSAPESAPVKPAAPEAAPAKARSARTRTSAPVFVATDFPVPEFPEFTASGFENADPEYYTRQAESLFEFHHSNIHRSFDQLTLLLTVLTRKDKEMKERLRKQLKSFLENMAKSISQWPPAIKMS
ncbi:Protein of unknown function (DUF3102) [Desulfosporosinus orientis DSM 765]|uniref:DUF3102 domain-containing protein n=1 Tax=Desulfosporosinus orientis (strain ATCC 19365 / DSM 765 / NCIMB 8382 / VKM B-1628 / Singapore I) TaxID=768706 RepID=G7W6K6_DESOD|nr:DUF3102 domain-containing protein [Desulfosporosinus orientis]AET68644.1 Protein of unknown function (DUF3102) [Desulfosporosinus orientis DSM 765]